MIFLDRRFYYLADEMSLSTIKYIKDTQRFASETHLIPPPPTPVPPHPVPLVVTKRILTFKILIVLSVHYYARLYFVFVTA